MAASRVSYWFPSGPQYHWGHTPKVGDKLREDGQEWVVLDVKTEPDGTISVTLRPVEPDPTRDGDQR